MKHKVPAAFGVFLALCMVLGTLPVGAQESPGLPEIDTDAQLEIDTVFVWQLQREEYGLRALSDDALRRISRSRQGSVRTQEWGIPVTASEERELIARDELAERVHLVHESAAHSDSYAGAYVEITNGRSRVVVTSTDRLTQAAREEIRDIVGDRSRIRFEPGMERTLVELQATFDELTETALSPDLLHTISLNVQENQIEVSFADEAVVNGPDANAVRQPESRQVNPIAGLEGVAVVAGNHRVTSACANRRTCDTPLRAGLQVVNDTRGGGLCSSSFAARDLSNANRYIMTAAHCGDHGDEFTIGGRSGGGALSNYFLQDQAQFFDGAILRVDSAQAKPRLYRTDSNKWRAITTRGFPNSIASNNVYCVHGESGNSTQFGRRCGGAIAGQLSVIASGVVEGRFQEFHNQFDIRVTIPGVWSCNGELALPYEEPVIGGVSGGAVTNWNGATAVGIQSNCTLLDVLTSNQGAASVFRLGISRIRNVEDALGVMVLTT